MSQAKALRTVELNYAPHDKQAVLHRCPATEVLFGGAAGPGKSHGLRHEGFDWCCRIPGLMAFLFRRDYNELMTNHVLPGISEFPAEICKWNGGEKWFKFHNGSYLIMRHCQHESDVEHYQGAEIHVLLIDELTHFTEFMYKFLRARVRCTLNIPEEYRSRIPRIVCATNPGGRGHGWVKQNWGLGAAGRQPYHLYHAPESEGGMIRTYIPGLLSDNPTIIKNDPGYVNRLRGLGSEAMVKAWLHGDWDIYEGQAFSEWDPHTHVIDDHPVPEGYPIYRTFDWGYGKPFSVGWWYVDDDKRMIRFAEWYGCSPQSADTGLRMTDSAIAQGIIEREREFVTQGMVLGYKPDQAGAHDFRLAVTGLAGHDCWNRKPNYQGGGQGPSTAEIFTKMGLVMVKADVDRELKYRAFHQALSGPIRDSAAKLEPKLLVMRRCKNFIRLIPELQTDPSHIEDVDTKGEDHIYDEACQIVMYRVRSKADQEWEQSACEDHKRSVEEYYAHGGY